MPIDSHLSYLEKHAYCAPQILCLPNKNLDIVLVIPCYDEPDLISCLNSILTSGNAEVTAEVIVVISSSATDAAKIKRQNLETLAAAEEWANDLNSEWLQFHFLHFPDLPNKHAGVGLTRKIGMDEAIHRFNLAGKSDGIIVSLDADTLCEANYLSAIVQHFVKNPRQSSCSITYAHPLSGTENPLIEAAILRIELAHRLLIAGLRHAAHPYAFPTLGAAMAVRASAYQMQAGMNKRKVGEDFYFLQKFIELGVHGECNTTTVYPQARISTRKPAGFGQMIAQYCASPDPVFPIFATKNFLDLKLFLTDVSSWYSLDKHALELVLEKYSLDIKDFMELENFVSVLQEIQKYTNSQAAFKKRFYRWFNSLKVFQYLRFCSENHSPNEAILDVGNALKSWIVDGSASEIRLEILLAWFRGNGCV